MDFVLGLYRTRKLRDSFWVIVDRMTKSAPFIHVMSTYRSEDYSKLFIDDIVRWHSIPLSIITDRGSKLTCNFWRFSKKS